MSTSSKNLKIGFGLVIIALVVSAGALISISLLVPPVAPPLEGEADVQVIKGDTTIDLNFTSLTALPAITGISSSQNRFQNWRGTGTYLGVAISTLVELVGGMDEDDVVRINATDGYVQYFAYYNLYPNSSFSVLQGQLILAYSFNGTTPTTWGDGPRTVFLAPDGAYSNDDANQTTHPAWFFGSAGARWVRNVASIEVIRNIFVGGSFHVTVLDEASHRDIYLVDLLLMKSLEAFSAYQRNSGSWGGNGTYVGISLSAIVELLTPIDSNDVIRVTASGYSQNYSHYNLYPNSTIHAIQGDLILAFSLNDTLVPNWMDGFRIVFLPPDGGYSNNDASLTTYPAWFDGSGGSRWVKNVLTIEIYRDQFS